MKRKSLVFCLIVAICMMLLAPANAATIESIHVTFDAPRVGTPISSLNSSITTEPEVTAVSVNCYAGNIYSELDDMTTAEELDALGAPIDTPTVQGEYTLVFCFTDMDNAFSEFISFTSTSGDLTPMFSSSTGIFYNSYAYVVFPVIQEDSGNGGNGGGGTGGSGSGESGGEPSGGSGDSGDTGTGTGNDPSSGGSGESNDTTQTKDVLVTYSPPEDEVRSYNISWGNLSFTYEGQSDGVWDPVNHRYSDPTDGRWLCEDGADTISVVNHSNIPITVSFDFEPVVAFSHLQGQFLQGSTPVITTQLPSAENTVPENAPQVTVKLVLLGELEEDTTDDSKGGVVKLVIN